DIAHGAEPHRDTLDALAFAGGGEVRDRHQQRIAAHHLARVRIIERRKLDAFADDVGPDVRLGPIRQRKDPKVLANAEAKVEEIPEFGTLRARAPGAEGVAVREDALL